jgi:hypothetical protein
VAQGSKFVFPRTYPFDQSPYNPPVGLRDALALGGAKPGVLLKQT